MRPRILKTEADYEAAIARVDELMGAQAGTPEVEELELWSRLVVAYEEEHEPIDFPDPLEAIRIRMEHQGLSLADVAPWFGGEAEAAAVLDGDQPLTLPVIRRLHAELGIPADILIQEPRPTEPSPAG